MFGCAAISADEALALRTAASIARSHGSFGARVQNASYHRPAMAERAAVERELEEIRAQLGWVRDYL
jgi:hypothetical protein